jgi:hypothetical protein
MADPLKLPYIHKDQARGDFQIWIDDAITEKERGFVLLHELHERNRMAGGMPYSQAHAESSRLEFRCRHHPDELHDSLAAEGWA